MTDEFIDEIERLATEAIENQLAYYSGDVVLDAETFYAPVLRLVAETKRLRRRCPACTAHTVDVGYVHVLTTPGGPCAPTCPHPDHRTKGAPMPLAVEFVIHQAPPPGQAVTPCCERTPFELPVWDRMTTDPAAVTCEEPDA